MGAEDHLGLETGGETVLRDAWPAIAVLERHHLVRREVGDLSVHASESEVVRAAGVVAHQLATLAADGDQVANIPLHRLFHGLDHDESDIRPVSVRCHNATLRQGVRQVRSLVAASLGDIRTWPQVGARTLAELVVFTAVRSAAAFRDPQRLSLHNDVDESTACADQPRGHDGRGPINPTPPNELDPQVTDAAHRVDDAEERPIGVEFLRRRLADRELEILVSRVLEPDGRTLEDIGRAHGLSRERIRQLQREAKDVLAEFLDDESSSQLRQAAATLSALAGSCCLASRLEEIEMASSDDPLEVRLVSWLAGPYEVVEELAIRAPAKQTLGGFRSALTALIDQATVTRDDVERALDAAGVDAHAVDTVVRALGFSWAADDTLRRATKRNELRTGTVEFGEPDGPRPLSGEYLEWNRRLVGAFFDGRNAQSPVYLDLEEGVLEELADGEAEHDVRARLVGAVKDTLHFEPYKGTFSDHEAALATWSAHGQGVPPFVGLLCLFSLAAESMRTDGVFAANNYYGRLAELLAVDGAARAKLQRDFGAKSGLFWDALNQWLTDAGGAHGLPTAQAFDRRVHVGLAISQALVREADRRTLAAMFVHYRLDPGRRIGREDMMRLLDLWIGGPGASPTLRRLWSSPDAKPRIAEVAIVELEAWDGSDRAIAQVVDRQAIPIVLIAGMRRNPRPRIDFELAARTRGGALDTALVQTDDADEPSRKALEAAGGRLSIVGAADEQLTSLTSEGAISYPDLLVSRLQLVDGHGARFHREPRKLVVLEFDEENARYVETDRAEMGRDLLLLVSEAKESALADVLKLSARTGYRRIDARALLGLPAGWVAFTSVELVASPDSNDVDLAPLQPLLLTHVVLGGGLRLPGHSTWHSRQPPEVRVTSLDPRRQVTAFLEAAPTLEDHEPTAVELGGGRGALVFKLDAEQLADGDYRVTVENAKGEMLTSAPLHLRDGSQPRAVQSETVLAHALGGGAIGAITSSPTPRDDHGMHVIGAVSFGLEPRLAGTTLPAEALDGDFAFEEDDERDDVPTIGIHRLSTEVADCLLGAAHHFVLPDAGPGAPKGLEIQGTCRKCGYVKVFPPLPPWRRHWKKRPQRPKTEAQQLRADADRMLALARRVEVAPIVEARGVDHSLLLDCLTYASLGTWASFERLASRANDDPWEVSEAARLFSALGHVDLELDPSSLRPVSWEVGPAAIVVPSEGHPFLAGRRSDVLLTRLRKAVGDAGGTMHEHDQDSGPAQVVISGLAEARLEDVATAVSAETGTDVRVQSRVAERLASNLPPLSHVIASLPKLPEGVAASDRLERFNFDTGRWERCAFSARATALRVAAFPRRYVAWTDGGPRLVDNRIVKWSERRSRRPMMAYDAAARVLIVRLGAQLPGLYERAAVLASGRSPLKRTNGTVEYPGVSRDLAKQLYSLMTG